jgi:hypothetical protein
MAVSDYEERSSRPGYMGKEIYIGVEKMGKEVSWGSALKHSQPRLTVLALWV